VVLVVLILLACPIFITQATDELKVLATQLAGLNASLKSEIDQGVQLSTHLADARKTNDKQAEEIIRLNSELRDRMAENQRLTAAERVRVERIHELDEQVTELQSQLSKAGISPGAKPETTVAVGTDARITGEITIVRGNLASINIGSAHGVVKGMEMTIYRGGQFVGTVRIEDVSVRTSAGVITQKHLTPVRGDKVTNRLID
jgi:cell shape-determining protein MreC